MAGWGTGSFENEDAQTFLKRLDSLDIGELRQILVRAAGQDGYLDASESSTVIVAAEVVATAKGMPSETVPPQIAEWVSKIEGTPSPEMSEVARRAVSKVRANSELKDLWLQAEGLNEWTAGLQNLQDRLAG